jgi:SAM-dependent MidA family methyltransferase
MPLGPARVSGPAPLAAILADRIRAHGPITFAEYMHACLYHPEHGYYTKADQQPRRDYFTSVDVQPLFGRLLARQFFEMWAVLGRPAPFTLVEAAAGTGALAQQILDFAAESWPQFYDALYYVTVEKSDSRRRIHRTSLAQHRTNAHAASVAEMPAEIPVGCIFSNELFDAMPVHRVVQTPGGLRELYVGLGPNGFHEVAAPLSSPRLAEYFKQHGITLSDDQQAEVGLDACTWIEAAGRAIQRGFILTIDYGHEAPQLYDARHMRGTLLAYSRHRASEDYFRAPGDQDLTAHVNFTALDLRGRRAGLARTGITSQTSFLMSLARHSDFADLQSETMNEQQQSLARLLFKTLIHPEGMGETFRVLIQHKAIDAPHLAGLDPI